MPNAEHDTPTSGDLNAGDAEGRRILEGLREHLRESGSLAGSLQRRADALAGAALRRFVAHACREFRGLHDVEGDLIRLGEKFSSGFDAITIRDLRVAPPTRSRAWRRAGVTGLRLLSGAGGFTAAIASVPQGPCPWWVGIIGAAVACAAGLTAPGWGQREGGR